jgi:hypothetical protein
MDSPTVADLSLPRYVLGNNTIKQALGNGAPPGMFLINMDTEMMEQWVMDHWEPVGVWAVGTADDPFANVQIAAARGAGFAPAGGGGVAPAPRPPGSPSITEPGHPSPGVTPGGTTIVQNGDPGVTGPGVFWLKPSTGQVFVRNPTDTGWTEICRV